MKTFLVALVLMMMTSTIFATMIQTKIPKGSVLPAESTTLVLDRSVFPQQSYQLRIWGLKNNAFQAADNGGTVRIKNAQMLRPDMELSLVSYNKSLGTYQFQVKLASSITLLKNRSGKSTIIKKIPANIKLTIIFCAFL